VTTGIKPKCGGIPITDIDEAIEYVRENPND
jgi:hypothetical protein